jgi:hypothetical protein
MTFVHRFWTGAPRPGHQWTTAVVQWAHPDADVAEWTTETLPPDLLALLDPGDDPRHLSNVARYWLLHEYGGLWLDHDVIPLRDLTGGQQPWTASLRGRREGAAMWFPAPGHLMLAELVAVAALGASPSAPSPIRSGARVLHRVGLRYPEVAYEPRVLPLDALGRHTGIGEVWAVAQWQTSSANLSRAPLAHPGAPLAP